MNALVLALSLALGPGGFEEDRLPRSLSESVYPPVAAPAGEDHEVLVGIHLGAASSADGGTPSFVAGFEWRIHILPWLGALGTVDYLTKEQADNLLGADVLQVPFMWSVLLYPPIDLGPFRPYGQAGVGFTITDVSGVHSLDSTDINLLYSLGFGVEFKLGSSLLLNADVRYIWGNDPPGPVRLSGDWKQVTVGLLYKLGM
jgi:opacity protein-like surface antigen